jgi:hypothetical protein
MEIKKSDLEQIVGLLKSDSRYHLSADLEDEIGDYYGVPMMEQDPIEWLQFIIDTYAND